ncbi:MAG: hydantoinase/oxoprolinase family protein [Gammaproteobacteria bacterium]|nr:hydantoinase/oxoprolinase family protein [Gammaproteobacteria bacterium]
MAVLLGIDTGGTYTDAVLFDDGDGVLSTAKALTTRGDLTIGIGESVNAVLAKSQVSAADVALISLSTTLATNALVEGQGGRVALVLIGFDDHAVTRAGLAEALRGEPCIRVDGGHDGHGEERHALDAAALALALSELPPVDGFAVAGMFAVRNPAHEVAARDLIRVRTGCPVTCSHELSAKLDGPRRAMTAVLNARLIPMIQRLLLSAQRSFDALNIAAPLMVVRGDGALVSAELARQKPVETLLSGPAASLVGAAYLSDERDAIVSDIGGTTTDYAFLEDARPRLDACGATVGGFRTMVEAVAMRTIGLGGDSEIVLHSEGTRWHLNVGPRRVIPVSLFATEYSELVTATLERQLAGPRRDALMGCFAVLVGGFRDGLTINAREAAIYARLRDGPLALDTLISAQLEVVALNQLVARGLVARSGVTPTDAAHVAGLHAAFNGDVAEQALMLFAGQRNNSGLPIAESAAHMSAAIIEALVRASAHALLDAACAADGHGYAELARYLFDAGARSDGESLVRIATEVSRPVIGLGAPAAVYYPQVVQQLGTRAVVPKHAEVANAVGAVVGRVGVGIDATVTQPSEGVYRAFVNEHRADHPSLEAAVDDALRVARAAARRAAAAAGAEFVELSEQRVDRKAVVEGKETFVESAIRVQASGRPRFAVSC